MDTFAYYSFLLPDLSSSPKITGGHYEVKADLDYFESTLSSSAYLYVPPSLQSNISLIPVPIRRFFHSSRLEIKFLKKPNPCIACVPIFGKRGMPNSDCLTHTHHIVADSRSFFTFLYLLIHRRKIIFKSHGSLSQYFFGFVLAYLSSSSLTITSFPLRLRNIFINSFLGFLFFFVELFIYVFSAQIYMMRSSSSMSTSLAGTLFNLFFSHKTTYSSCSSVYTFLSFIDDPPSPFPRISSSLAHTFTSSSPPLIYVFGDWSLFNNQVSLLEFLHSVQFPPCSQFLISGQSTPKFDLQLNRTFTSLHPNHHLDVLGYIPSIEEYLCKSDYVVAAASYGSGIPIKAVEILLKSARFKYIPIISAYASNALKNYPFLDSISYLSYNNSASLTLTP